MPDHVPVLLAAVLEALAPRPGQNVVDGTFGRGGHARALLERLGPTGRLFVFDLDPRSVVAARELAPNVVAFHENFSELASTLRRAAPGVPIHGILLDLGVSSAQLADPSLGLSFQRPGALDMRLSRDGAMTAATIVNSWPERRLAEIFATYGEERHARRVAAAVVSRRRRAPFTSTTELAGCVARALGRRRGAATHPATKVFQALRIAVNDELGNLRRGLAGARNVLAPAGRLAVISFHSLEDRIVKQAFREASRRCVCPADQPRCTCARQPLGAVLTKKPISPTLAELRENPRARSARLRVFQKSSVV